MPFISWNTCFIQFGPNTFSGMKWGSGKAIDGKREAFRLGNDPDKRTILLDKPLLGAR